MSLNLGSESVGAGTERVVKVFSPLEIRRGIVRLVGLRSCFAFRRVFDLIRTMLVLAIMFVVLLLALRRTTRFSIRHERKSRRRATRLLRTHDRPL